MSRFCRLSLPLSLVIALLVLPTFADGPTTGAPPSAAGTSPAVDTLSSDDAYVTGTVPGDLRDDYSGFVGMQVVVGSSPIIVSQLGRIKAPGNASTHVVKWVNAVDGMDLPGGAAVVAMAGGVTGEFHYATLASPVMLTPGATYWVVSEEMFGGDSWYDGNTTLTTTGAAAATGLVWGTGPGLWGTSSGQNRAGVPVNFKYRIGSTDNRALVVTSAYPDSGVRVTVSPPDTNGLGEGVTPFTRIYNVNTRITLSAPFNVGGDNLTSWQRDGLDYVITPIFGMVMDANHTTRAMYGIRRYVTGYSAATLRNDFSGWVGMQFTVGATPLSIRELGRHVVAGSSGVHTLKLVKAADGSDIPGASVSIATKGVTPVNGPVYARLRIPVTVAANTTYWLVSEETAGGDKWFDSDGTQTTTGVAGNTGFVWSVAPGVWGKSGVGGRSVVPVDFKHASTPNPYVTSTVPGSLRNDFAGWVGLQILVGPTAIPVSHLGRFVAPGNSGAHQVKLVKGIDQTDVPGSEVTIATAGATAG